MNTPKERFLQSGKSEAFKTISATDAFDVACDYALLQLQHELPANTQPGIPTDPYIGLDANAQIHGAQRLISILKTLHEPPAKSTPQKYHSLNYA